MRTWYFSENAYPYLPEELDNYRVSIPNRYYNPKVGAELYHRYLDEWQLADELGLDLMANEHHQTAVNLNPAAPLVMSALARITKKGRLLILGNPIANRRDPVRVAEEMAMIDNYSQGRLEVGFVRGVPYEISAANSNPIRMTERMWEAHDLIIKAWTSHDGPFNWEGRFFQHRQVNIWPRPYQEPHPPVWITAMSTSYLSRIADLDYTAATFLSGMTHTKALYGAYRARRREFNRSFSENRLAYAGIVYVGETDEEGLAGARKIMWIVTKNLSHPQFKDPPGYSVPKLSAQLMQGKAYPFDQDQTIEKLIDQGIAFAGNPDTVYRQIERHYNHVGGYGNLLMLGQSGFLEHDETVKGIKLFAQEVYPRLLTLKLNTQSEDARASETAH
ncbi:MAG: LLM class flavin-dependent oxidoreductase [Alphaproteobacteria bacterium]|nr:LLM class flavin-dependent oxidoreductase [Alphaproteobacteria bacterium]